MSAPAPTMDIDPKPSDEGADWVNPALAPAATVKADDSSVEWHESLRQQNSASQRPEADGITNAEAESFSQTCWRRTFWLLTIWTRLVASTFVVFAIWSFFEIRDLQVGSGAMDAFEIVDDVLRVPLVLCLPTSLVIDDVIYTTRLAVDQNNIVEENCRSLDYMIYAVALSLLLSALAVIAFLIVDTAGRMGGHMDRTRSVGKYRRLASKTVAGMGLLLLFQLIQTGISTGALVEQLNAWVNYVEKVIKNSPTAVTEGNEDVRNPAADIDHVESLANIWVLITSSILSFIAAFWIFVDAVFIYPCRPISKVEDPHNYASTS